jgi:hypothetical protein
LSADYFANMVGLEQARHGAAITRSILRCWWMARSAAAVAVSGNLGQKARNGTSTGAPTSGRGTLGRRDLRL